MRIVTTGEGEEDMLELQGYLKGRRGGPRRPTGLALGAAMAVLVLAASLAAMALAAGTVTTVGSLSSSKLGERIVVNAHGRTLYALSPETTHHLLCKGECFKFWPPLTVSSSKTKLRVGPGVSGSLGILHRSNGMLQVTLRGMPLYRYDEDHAKGQTNGQGIKSFGGTWHAVTAAADPSKAPASTDPGSSGTSGSNNQAGGGGGYESPGTNTSTSTNPTTTTPTSTTPTYTAPKEEKTPPKEESTAEREAREKREKEAREKREKEEKEYPPGW
jgi:predicted lipoprotein with Yx(FWY)xxD motif